ncbi:MAG: hypothetical protein ABI759_03525 [Candidatus Solibacter sp.]
MNPGLVVKLRPAGPWRIGPDSGARNRVDMIYHSDSLYSAVTSAMSRMGLLEAWLDATARSQTPAVCFSSCFPFVEDTAFVVPPRTLWPPTSPAAMSARVRWKSARFIPLTMVESILSGRKLNENQWSVDGASGCLMASGKKGPFRTSLRFAAAVDRLSGASERHATACIEFREGCGLWTVVGFPDEAARDGWQERVKAAFRLLADTGFGGERSRGWGRAETPEFVAGMLPGLIIEYKPRAAGAPSPVEEPETEEQPPVTEPPADEPGSAPVPPLEEGSAAAEVAAALAAAMEAEREEQPVAEEIEAVAPPEQVSEAAGVEGVIVAAPEADAVGSGSWAAASDQASDVVPETAGVAEVSAAAPEADIVPEAAPAEEVIAAAPDVDAVAAESAAAPSEPVSDIVPEAAPAEEVIAAAPDVDAVAAESAAAPSEPASDIVPVAAVVEEAIVAAPEVDAAAVDPSEPAPDLASEGAVPEAVVASPDSMEEPAPAAPSAEAAEASEIAPVEAVAAETGAPQAPQEAAVRARRERAPLRTAPEPEFLPAPIPSHLKAHWLLSLFTPAANDAVDWGRGNYAVLARGGRIESPAAGSGELKKQIQMVTEGSVLYSDGVPLGAAADVAPDGFAHPVFRAGFALAIPLPEVN